MVFDLGFNKEEKRKTKKFQPLLSSVQSSCSVVSDSF